MKNQIPCSEIQEKIPSQWKAIPSSTRQGKMCSCAYTVLKILGAVYHVSDSEWEQAFQKLNKGHNALRSLLGYSMDEADILSMLRDIRIPNELLNAKQTLIDARLAAGDGIICSFDQYSCGYVVSALQKLRSAVKNRSEHSILLVAKLPDGYLAFDPGWARGGWQILSHTVFQKVLSDPLNTFIAVASPQNSVAKIKVKEGFLFVNGYNGHWVYSGEEELNTQENQYLYRQEQLVLPFQQEKVFAPTQYVINVTNRCNLGCRYCYMDSLAKGEDMTPECFGECVEAAYRLSRCQPISIILHGGEPLLVLKKYEDVLDQLRKKIPEMSLSLQTSGVDMTADLLRIIEKNQIQFGVSLDGPEHIHNSQRNQFTKTMDMLKTLKKHRLFSGTISTLTKLSCQHMEEILDFFVENEFYSIAFSPMVTTGRGLQFAHFTPTADDLLQAYLVAWKKLLEYRSKGLPVEMREFSQMLVHLVSNIRPTVCGYTPCAACKHILGVDVNGDAYVCDMLIKNPHFNLGRLTELNENKINAKFPNGPFCMNSADYVKGCNQCNWRKTCMRGCPSNNIFFETCDKESYFCHTFQHLFQQLSYDISTNQTAYEYVQEVALKGLKELNILSEEAIK